MIRPPRRPTRRTHASSPARVLLAAVTPLLVLACLVATAPRAASAPATPEARTKPATTLTVQPESLRADANGMWRLSLNLENHTEWGLYPDSLFLDWAGEPQWAAGTSISGTTDLSRLVRGIQPASSNGATSSELNMPAEIARGRLEFRIYLHDKHNNVHAARTNVLAVGSALAERARSARLDVDGRATDLLMLAADSSAGAAGGILLVPRAGNEAWKLLRWAVAQTEGGYSVAVLGTVGTAGTPGATGATSAAATASLASDPTGPASVGLIRGAAGKLAREPGFAGGPLVVWGEGSGATAALLAAASHSGFAGVIAVDATYDPWAAYRAAGDSARAAFVRGAGKDSAAWRARAPLLVAERIRAPVLVLQTEHGGPYADAKAFVALRAAKSLPTESRMGDAESLPLRRQDVTRLTRAFLARHARGTPP